MSIEERLAKLETSNAKLEKSNRRLKWIPVKLVGLVVVCGLIFGAAEAEREFSIQQAYRVTDDGKMWGALYKGRWWRQRDY